jgi:transcription factor C subunit 7
MNSHTGISEWYSPATPHTGLHPRPGFASSLLPHFPLISPAHPSLYLPPRLGEEIPALHARCGAFLGAFVPHVEQTLGSDGGKDRRVLLVSHAAVVIALLSALVGRDVDVRIGCCSLSEVVRAPVSVPEGEGERKALGGWVAKRLGSGAHLQDGALREWGFEDVVIADGKGSALVFFFVSCVRWLIVGL